MSHRRQSLDELHGRLQLPKQAVETLSDLGVNHNLVSMLQAWDPAGRDDAAGLTLWSTFPLIPVELVVAPCLE